MSRPKIPEEKRNTVIDLLKQDFSIASVARMTGLSESYARNVRNEEGISRSEWSSKFAKDWNKTRLIVLSKLCIGGSNDQDR